MKVNSMWYYVQTLEGDEVKIFFEEIVRLARIYLQHYPDVEDFLEHKEPRYFIPKIMTIIKGTIAERLTQESYERIYQHVVKAAQSIRKGEDYETN